MISIRVLSTIALLFISVASTHVPFDPRDYPKKVVTCPAINRAKNSQVDIDLRMNLFLRSSVTLGGSNPNSGYSQTTLM
jgi:hypothetical protein